MAITPNTPRIFGYISGMLDLKGNAYTSRDKALMLYINGVKEPQMQKDLKRWIGGGTIKVDTYDGDRRGCAAHCDTAHFHYTRTSARYVVSGLRALCVLHTLEMELFEWERKFAKPYHDAIQRIEEISTTKDGQKILRDMSERGWEIP